MTSLSIASIQMNSSGTVCDNFETAILLIEEAVYLGAKVVVLPEYFLSTSDDVLVISSYAEHIGCGVIQEKLSKIAEKFQIYLIAGTIPTISINQNKFYNTCIIFDNNGKIATYYNKIHLFTSSIGYDENNVYIKGNKIVQFSVNNFSFGIGVCYDLRFPELFRDYAGVDAIIVPSAFTYETGKLHWEVLLRARAIENQCYVVASNQTGAGEILNKRNYGHSMIVDPLGRINSVLNNGNGVIFSHLRKDVINETRNKIPSLLNRCKINHE